MILKNWIAGMVLIGVVLSVVAAPAAKPAPKAAAPVKWKLKYTEDFNGTKLNEKLWSRIDQGKPDWCKNMSTRPDLVKVKDGQLHCYGVKNNDLSADARSVLTGGVSMQHKFAVKYGKIEIKCKLQAQKGAWPAIWMMPEVAEGQWPECGEIDIVERLNFDDFVYQTVHSGWAESHPNDPPRGGRGKIKPDDWNIYTLEWTPEELVWYVNGQKTHTYRKVDDDHSKWPWTCPFYLMIDMQLGGSWVGTIDESTLPTAMHVDWVKFYAGSRGTTTFTEFVRPEKK